MGTYRAVVALCALVFFSCSDSSSTGSGTVTSAISGSWDVSKLGDDPAGAGSVVVVANDTVTGPIIDKDEGVTIDGCTATKHRVELDLKFQGNALSGTATAYSQWSGPASSCPSSDNPEVVTITGSRSGAGSGLDGVWELNVGKEPVVVVDIQGGVAKAWDKNRLLRKEDPAVTATVAGGSAVTSAKNDDFAFAAKRR